MKQGLICKSKTFNNSLYFILNYRSTDLIDCMDLQPAAQQLLHEPSLQEGNIRKMGELDAEEWELV